MGKYIQNTLIEDEKVIYEGRLSKLAFLPHFFLILFFAIPTSGLALALLVPVFLKIISTELAFTNKRVIAKFGFIKRSTVELKVDKVESVQIQQGILGRIFNFGSLIVSGAGTPQTPIPKIANPMNFRKAFMEYQEKA
tara:strand:- start:766 stop:1179 length:414 start_codon:yes stop_codon:yes gene_type:complete